MAYDASNIKVLEGLEAVRVRPAMYIGSTTQKGLNHLIYEIVDNAVDEASNGYGTNIYVWLNANGSCTVLDEGRGIPVDLHESGVSALRVVLTTLHAGGKFDNNSYKSSGGLHGVGSSVVNALSSKFIVDVLRSGKVYEDVYEFGKPVTQLVDGMVPVVGKCGGVTGTRVIFTPDASIFPNTEFKLSDIQQRLHQTAYLNPNLTIYLYDNRNEQPLEFVYHEPNGIKAYVDELSKDVDELSECYTFNATQESEKGAVQVHVAFKYVQSLKETVIGFCNNIQTHEGGTHLTGFKSSLTSLINSYARQLGSLKASEDNFTGTDVRSGLIAVVSIQHPDPQFEGQTKTKLDNPEVAKIVSSVCTEQLTLYFDRNVDVLKRVIAVALRCRKLRKAEASAHKNFFAKRKKYSFDSNGKLAGCESKDASTCELFIVEGDSAAGSGKMARDRKHQAILPIRGKILNVEKCTVNKALANEEIKTIIYALGCGFGEGYGNDFDISKLKYDKIICMCFTGDTKVKCLDGNSYSFKELVDNDVKKLWVYSRDEQGNTVPALATNPHQTGTTTRLCEVVLDNGRVTKCTPDHLFMLEDGTYKEAQYLQPGDSLAALHMKQDSHGYNEYYDTKIRRWKFVHHLVGDILLQEEKIKAQERFELESNKEYRKTVVIHHKDSNRTNNVPDNLLWLTNREHAKLHRDIAARNITSYNISDKHREDVKAAYKRGAYLGKNDFTSTGYNYSKKHNEVIKRVNASDIHIKSAKQGKIAKSIRYMLNNNIDVNQQNYDKWRLVGAESYKNILKSFNSYEEAISFALAGTWLFEDYIPVCCMKKYDNGDKTRRQIGNVIYKILQDNKEFNRTTYTQYKGVTTVKYDNILQWFDSYEEAIEYAKNKNHKVVSVQVFDVSETPVYCLTVEGNRNFVLDDGQYVHNCDSDSDGSHIVTLLLTLFYRLMPEIISNGHLYCAVAPLYRVFPVKGTPKYIYTDKDLSNYLKNHKVSHVQRYKGLGEMNPDQLWETTMNPKTRMLRRVVIDDDASDSKVTEQLMGTDVKYRKEFIRDNAQTAEIDV